MTRSDVVMCCVNTEYNAEVPPSLQLATRRPSRDSYIRSKVIAYLQGT